MYEEQPAVEMEHPTATTGTKVTVHPHSKQTKHYIDPHIQFLLTRITLSIE